MVRSGENYGLCENLLTKHHSNSGISTSDGVRWVGPGVVVEICISSKPYCLTRTRWIRRGNLSGFSFEVDRYRAIETDAVEMRCWKQPNKE